MEISRTDIGLPNRKIEKKQQRRTNANDSKRAGSFAESASVRAALAAKPKPIESFQPKDQDTSSTPDANDARIRAIVNDLNNTFAELGMVPPPSRFGGIRLALSPDKSAPGASSSQAGNSSGRQQIMRLMMVKAMAKNMAAKLEETENLQ